MKLFLTLILFTQYSYADSFIQLCSRSASLGKNISFLQTDDDTIQQSGNCYDIITTKDRVGLYEKFIGMKVPGTKITTEESLTKTCKLKIYKLNTSKVKNSKLNVGVYNNLTDGHKLIKASEQSFIQTKEGRHSEISMGDSRYSIHCKASNNGLTLEFSHTGKSASVITSVFAPFDKITPIGELSSNSNDNSNDLNIKKGFGKRKSTGSSQTKFFVRPMQ